MQKKLKMKLTPIISGSQSQLTNKMLRIIPEMVPKRMAIRMRLVCGVRFMVYGSVSCCYVVWGFIHVSLQGLRDKYEVGA